MHISSSSYNLKDKSFPQIRLGIQGAPATGKTTSILTFPNVTVVDADNGLTKFAGENLNVIPLYDYDWTVKYLGKEPTKVGAQPNRRDALLKFLREDALKMTNEQTLFLDSWTSIQTFFDQQQELEPKITKDGKIDDFDFWARKIEYSEKLMVYLCSLKCNVAVSFHEMSIRDPKSGQLLEKLAPLMQGKFLAQIKKWFTDFFRMINEEEKDKTGKVTKCNYYWQVCSDNQFDCKTRLSFPEGTYRIEPHYKVFEQYRKKV